jgi:hypothetical protein
MPSHFRGFISKKNRIILASIRKMGYCPCPRCLIPKDRIRNLGMARDRQQRLTLARVDDETKRFVIANSRRLIYERNYAVDSSALERILKDQSLVPTSVSAHVLSYNL